MNKKVQYNIQVISFITKYIYDNQTYFLFLPKKNFPAYNIVTFTDNPIKRNPMRNITLSIIKDILFPNRDETGPTKRIGKYCPMVANVAKIVINYS